MIDYVIRGAEDDDIGELAENMRDLDRQEVYAATGATPLEALTHCMERKREAFTATADGVPFCMFGVTDLTSMGGGTPWLLTSQDILKHRRQLIKFSAPVAHYWRDNMYDYLINFVDARHLPALRWASHIGFEVREAKPYGVFGLPFHPIVMQRFHHV